MEEMNDHVKRCRICESVMLLTNFQKHHSSKDGRMSICRSCRTAGRRHLTRAKTVDVKEGEKQCRGCGKVKLLNKFKEHAMSNDGRMNFCRKCHFKKLAATDPAFKNEKRCRRCVVVKPQRKFNTCASSKDGLQAFCKLCQSEVGRISNKRRRKKEWEAAKTKGLPAEEIAKATVEPQERQLPYVEGTEKWEDGFQPYQPTQEDLDNCRVPYDEKDEGNADNAFILCIGQTETPKAILTKVILPFSKQDAGIGVLSAPSYSWFIPLSVIEQKDKVPGHEIYLNKVPLWFIKSVMNETGMVRFKKRESKAYFTFFMLVDMAKDGELSEHDYMVPDLNEKKLKSLGKQVGKTIANTEEIKEALKEVALGDMTRVQGKLSRMEIAMSGLTDTLGNYEDGAIAGAAAVESVGRRLDKIEADIEEYANDVASLIGLIGAANRNNTTVAPPPIPQAPGFFKRLTGRQ